MLSAPISPFLPVLSRAVILLLGCLLATPLNASQTVIAPSGAYALVDPEYDLPGSITNVGAVSFYTSTGEFMCMIHGSTADDRVGSGGATVVGDQGWVVKSPLWDNGTVANAGAVTSFPSFAYPSTLVVSASNSLIGTSANDQVGSGSVTPLSNSLFAVSSPLWDNGSTPDVGAVSFGVLSFPFNGEISAANSLVGSSPNDQIGSGGITVVYGGAYVICSPMWDNGGVADAGAVTWGPPTGPMHGEISAANSMVGTTANDQLGSGGVVLLDARHFVVRSPLWDNGSAVDAGAVTFGIWWIPSFGGMVTIHNSLVGSSSNDRVGSGGITVVDGVGYVILSPHWNSDGLVDAGAITVGGLPDSFIFPTGVISTANSLVGSSANDHLGSGGGTLVNGVGCVILSPQWDNAGLVDVGAITVTNHPGSPPVLGSVSAANSLVGSTANDQVGSGGITLVEDGGFAVRSPMWDNGSMADAGAVTVGGIPGLFPPMTGVVSAANSLVGSTANDQVGSGGITVVSNVGYVVQSPQWDNGSAADAGAVTLSGKPGIYPLLKGVVSATNSLVGSSTGDQVSSGGVEVLEDVGFVVLSPLWDNGPVIDTGAVTLGVLPGTGPPFAGVVSAANSLVGSSASDQVGAGGITLLSEGCFLVHSPGWDNGTAMDAGALTLTGPPWLLDAFGGVVSAVNSLVGSSTNDQVGGNEVVLLGNNFLVHSPHWDNGDAADAGAVTLGGLPHHSGPFGGVVSAANSLVGSSSNDQVGGGGIVPMSGSGFLVFSPGWDNGAATDAGAVTLSLPPPLGVPTVGVVSAANSLVGTSPNDQVGSGSVTPFGSSGFVIHSPLWDNGTATEAGAVTVSGAPGIFPVLFGAVSSANSFVGSSANDQVGSGGITLLGNGESFVLHSPLWDNGVAANAGAVTLASSSIAISKTDFRKEAKKGLYKTGASALKVVVEDDRNQT